MFPSIFIIICILASVATWQGPPGMWNRPPLQPKSTPGPKVTKPRGLWAAPPKRPNTSNSLKTIKPTPKPKPSKPGIWTLSPPQLTTKSTRPPKTTYKPSGLWRLPPPVIPVIENPTTEYIPLGIWEEPPPQRITEPPNPNPDRLWLAPPPTKKIIVDESTEMPLSAAGRARFDKMFMLWGMRPMLARNVQRASAKRKESKDMTGIWSSPPPQRPTTPPPDEGPLGIWDKAPLPPRTLPPEPYVHDGIWDRPPPPQSTTPPPEEPYIHGVWDKPPPTQRSTRVPDDIDMEFVGMWNGPPPTPKPTSKQHVNVPVLHGVWREPPPYQPLGIPLEPVIKPLGIWSAPPPRQLYSKQVLDWNVLHGIWEKTLNSYVTDLPDTPTLGTTPSPAELYKILVGQPSTTTTTTMETPYIRVNEPPGIWRMAPSNRLSTKPKPVQSKGIQGSKGIWSKPPPLQPIIVPVTEPDKTSYIVNNTNGVWTAPPPFILNTLPPPVVHSNTTINPLGIWAQPPPLQLVGPPEVEEIKLYNISYGIWDAPPPGFSTSTSAKPLVVRHGTWKKPPPQPKRKPSKAYWINPLGRWKRPPPKTKLSQPNMYYSCNYFGYCFWPVFCPCNANLINPLGRLAAPSPKNNDEPQPQSGEISKSKNITGFWSEPPPWQLVKQSFAEYPYINITSGMWDQPPPRRPLILPPSEYQQSNLPLSSGIWSQAPPSQTITLPTAKQQEINMSLSNGIWSQPPPWLPIRSSQTFEYLPVSPGIWTSPPPWQLLESPPTEPQPVTETPSGIWTEPPPGQTGRPKPAKKDYFISPPLVAPPDLKKTFKVIWGKSYGKKKFPIRKMNRPLSKKKHANIIIPTLTPGELTAVKHGLWGTPPPWRNRAPLPTLFRKQNRVAPGCGYTNDTNRLSFWDAAPSWRFLAQPQREGLTKTESFVKRGQLVSRRLGGPLSADYINDTNPLVTWSALPSECFEAQPATEHVGEDTLFEIKDQSQYGQQVRRPLPAVHVSKKFGTPSPVEYLDENESFGIKSQAYSGQIDKQLPGENINERTSNGPPSELIEVPQFAEYQDKSFGKWGQTQFEQPLPPSYINETDIPGIQDSLQLGVPLDSLCAPEPTESLSMISSFWNMRNFKQTLPGPTAGYIRVTLPPGVWLAPPPQKPIPLVTKKPGIWAAAPPKLPDKLIVTEPPRLWLAPPPKKLRLPPATERPRIWTAPPPKRIRLPPVTKPIGVWVSPPPERLRPPPTTKPPGIWTAPPPVHLTPVTKDPGVWVAPPPLQLRTPPPNERINKYSSFWNLKELDEPHLTEDKNITEIRVQPISKLMTTTLRRRLIVASPKPLGVPSEFIEVPSPKRVSVPSSKRLNRPSTRRWGLKSPKSFTSPSPKPIISSTTKRFRKLTTKRFSKLTTKRLSKLTTKRLRKLTTKRFSKPITKRISTLLPKIKSTPSNKRLSYPMPKTLVSLLNKDSGFPSFRRSG